MKSYRAGHHDADAPAFNSDGMPEVSVPFDDPFASEPDPDTPAADERPVIGPEAWL